MASLTEVSALAPELMADRVLRGDRNKSVETLKPPFVIRDLSQIYIIGTLPDEAIEALLPKGLKKAADNMCAVGFYDAPDGWGITPYTGFYCGIVVDGYTSPDGTPGQFMITGSHSGVAGIVHQRDINVYYELAGPEISVFEGGARASVQLQDGRVDLDVSVVPGSPGHVSGTRLNLGHDRQQRLLVSTIAFTTPYETVHINRLSLQFAPGSRLAPLSQFVPQWSVLCRDKTMTLGVPYLAEERSAQTVAIGAQTGLLDVFDRLGKPAAVVNGRGDVLFFNGHAERAGYDSASLKPRDRGDRLRLESALHNAISRDLGRTAETVPVSTAHAKLAQIVPIHPAIAGEDAALAIFVDPGGQSSVSAVQALLLLGLTGAEARIAAAVGAGHSPRDAAVELGITESTARSTLRLVFDKLGVTRQAELARIVARLE